MKQKLRALFFVIGSHPRIAVIVLCTAISLVAMNRYTWRGEAVKRCISSDGLGYYSYLPAIFIYQDFKFDYYRDINRKYFNHDGYAPFINYTNGKFVNKYFAGEAILLLPFFLMACVLSMLFGYGVDGYGYFFQLSVGIAALFYVMTGLYFLMKYLAQYVSERAAAIAAAAIFLGTNLFFYTVFEPSESHAFSFALISWLIFAFDRSVKSRSTRSYYLIALLLGLVILTRPSNVLTVLALPFIAGRWTLFVRWIKGIFRWKVVLPCFLIVLAPVGIQSVLYHLQVDQWWIDAYGDEGFDFLHPELLNVLFSFRAGFFLWAPIALIAISGWWWWRKRIETAYWFWIFFAMNSWLISSWWAWHYEGTFGMRPMADHLPWFVLLLAGLLSVKKRWLRYCLPVVLLLFVSIQQIQAYQRFHVIIPWEGMDKFKYAYLFLDTNKAKAHFFSSPPDTPCPSGLTGMSVLKIDFEESTSLNTTDDAFSGHRSGIIPEGKETLIAAIPAGRENAGKRMYVSLEWLRKFSNWKNEGELMIQLQSGGESIWHSGVHILQPSPRANTWQFSYYSGITEPIRSGDDTLFVKIYNPVGNSLLIDNFKMVYGFSAE
ncbi:MAG: hypothetical protein IT223_10345 [Crocinitomicaceae bacterium]|nr:hypothetical protein [Crocinitomicaceae bacterium]